MEVVNERLNGHSVAYGSFRPFNLLPSCYSVLHSLPSVTHYVPRSGWRPKVGAKNRTKNQTR